MKKIDGSIGDFLRIMGRDVKKIEVFDKLGGGYNERKISGMIKIVRKRDSCGGEFGVYEDGGVRRMWVYNSGYVKFKKGKSLFRVRYNRK